MYGVVRKMKNYLRIFIHKKLGRLNINKCWILPFSVYIYTTGILDFNIYNYYQLIEIDIYYIRIILTWGD